MNLQDLLLDTVRLRALREDDLAALHALLSEEPVWRAFGHPGPPSYEALEADLPAMIAGKTSYGGQIHHMSAAIADAATDQLIGLIGLASAGDGADVLIALSEAVRGQGRGKEALAGLLAWVEDKTNLNQVLGATSPDNAASAAMMASCGMVETFENAATLAGNAVEARTFEWHRPR